MFRRGILWYGICLLLVSFILLSPACDKKHEEVVLDNPFDPDNPETQGDPYNMRTEVTADSVIVKWNEIPDIDGVAVYRSTSPDSGFEKVGTSTSGEYIDTDIQPGETYYYQLRAHRDGTFSSSYTVVVLIPGTALPGDITEPESITGKDGAKMVLIPEGKFEMGDAFKEGGADELPVHTVYLGAFYMDIYEVTNAQYARFLSDYGKDIDAAGHQLLNIGYRGCLIEKAGNNYNPKSGYEDHPAIEVSWYGAAAYAQFYGKRLPTEAEWEKAARGGLVGERYLWGNMADPAKANYDHNNSRDWAIDNMLKYLKPVGSFSPNKYGLYDMAGNVYDWCSDEYDSGYYNVSPPDNPKGPGTAIAFVGDDFTNVNTSSVRVLRGGSWGDTAYFIRAANRLRNNAWAPGSNQGFRCCASRSD